MPVKGTVQVEISRAQAATAAQWLRDDYRPRQPEQRTIAQRLAKQLWKASQRKREGATFTLAVSRDLSQWFGAFTEPDGWWDFSGERVRAQPAPDPIRNIAALFRRAVSRRKGRRNPSHQELVDQRDRLERSTDDSRSLRKNQAKIKNLEWAREETEKAKRSIKNSP
jgi:hypothetical protein